MSIDHRFENLKKRLSNLLRWLIPGLGVKRWLIPIILGTTLLSFGLAIVVLDIYRNAPDTWWLPILSIAALRSLVRPWRALIFSLIGIALIVWGMWGLYHSLLAPYRTPGRNMLEQLEGHRRKERGPKIAVIGGGHGLSTLLRGLKAYSFNMTAIVTVADDGGSSGRLRKSMGILPPGDIRDCLAALSNNETLLTQLFQYRFSQEDDSLQGHSFGNLFISALTEIMGSFENAVAESANVLAIHGRVLPATLHDVRLVADVILPNTVREYRIEGQSRIHKAAGQVKRVWLEPNSPPAYPEVIQAILAADLIVVGPGSLYTSVLPNLLVPDIAAAVQSSRALKFYICNVAIEPGETDGFTCSDHVRVLTDHVGDQIFDIVVANSNTELPPPAGISWVQLGDEEEIDYPIYSSDLLSKDFPGHHDSKKLSQVIIDLYQERTGPLVE